MESQGEKRIRNFLETNKVEYIQEKRFEDCRDKNPLPFDFYLPKLNVCIEFDGKQHFRIGKKYFGRYPSKTEKKELLKNIKRRDKIKSDYCSINNIELIRIKYTKLKEVYWILEEKLL